MIHRSFMPDVLSYNSALHGCARAGQWQQALLLFDQILAHGLVPSAWGPPKEIQVGDVFVGVSMVGKVCYRYPPTNIYIPPGKQETHLQKCLGRGILVPGRVWEKKTACKTCPFLSGE